MCYTCFVYLVCSIYPTTLGNVSALFCVKINLPLDWVVHSSISQFWPPLGTLSSLILDWGFQLSPPSISISQLFGVNKYIFGPHWWFKLLFWSAMWFCFVLTCWPLQFILHRGSYSQHRAHQPHQISWFYHQSVCSSFITEAVVLVRESEILSIYETSQAVKKQWSQIWRS